jgi:DNA polymerase-3 subunit alpha
MYIPLNTRSYFSLKQSAVDLKSYVETVANQGYQAIGLVDRNLHAAFQFVTLAKQHGLKPILGLNLDVQVQGIPMALSFIAKSQVGYHNLIKLSTLSNYGHQELTEFEAYLTDLAIIFPNNQLAKNYLKDHPLEAYFALEVSDVRLPGDNRAIAFHMVNMLDAKDNLLLDVLRAIEFNGDMSQAHQGQATSYLRPPYQYQELYQGQPQSLKNLEQLVNQVQDYGIVQPVQLPRFNPSVPAQEELLMMTKERLAYLGLDTKTYQDRLTYELSVIHDMGFDDYFLIVADILRFARTEDIYTGMGRGSSAGSLVAYLLQITHIDPVANDLLFERFLNPDRKSMPDIDLDLPDNKRDVFLHYLSNRYGSDHVSQVVTFDTFKAKSAIRDVGKAYGLRDYTLKEASRDIGSHPTIEAAIQENPHFRKMLAEDPELKRVVDVASRLQGFPKQKSVHASAVLLTDKPLVAYVSLAPSQDTGSLAISQYQATDAEKIGLLKIDFLGLSNLRYLETMKDLLVKKHGTHIDFLKINLNDPKTMALFARGDTEGIFQFENPAMKRFLQNLKPERFEDIVMSTAIFRPGASAQLANYIKLRHGELQPQYLDPSLKPILESTYGVIIFQEQIMQIVQVYAGFSLAKADLLRRAISKKQSSEFAALKAEFIQGALENGRDQAQAEAIYDLIERFAQYGFNRSHAFAYAALAVQIAYFKADYPDVFFEAMLMTPKRETMLLDTKAHGLTLQKMSVNRSPYHDKVEGEKVMLGLANIRDVSRDFALWIVDNRPFSSFEDFVRRVPSQYQKFTSLLPLVQVGAFDGFNDNRKQLEINIEPLIQFVTMIQIDLFDDSPIHFAYRQTEDYTQAEKYEAEMRLMGIAITAHPIEALKAERAKMIVAVKDLPQHLNQKVTVLVIKERVREIKTQKGADMVFMTVNDGQHTLDVTVFPETLTMNRHKFNLGDIFLIRGKVQERNGEIQLVADHFEVVHDTTDQAKLWLKLDNRNRLKGLVDLLMAYPGNHQVILHFTDTKETLETDYYVQDNDFFRQQLSRFVSQFVYR